MPNEKLIDFEKIIITNCGIYFETTDQYDRITNAMREVASIVMMETLKYAADNAKTDNPRVNSLVHKSSILNLADELREKFGIKTQIKGDVISDTNKLMRQRIIDLLDDKIQLLKLNAELNKVIIESANKTEQGKVLTDEYVKHVAIEENSMENMDWDSLVYMDIAVESFERGAKFARKEMGGE